MIYIRTCAYNAEKTLRKTIESVLSQTYQDFEYHILDNGSTDGTGKIVREYAERDKRIIPYFNCVNRDLTENPDFWNLSKRIPEEDFFCILDADDFYERTFFEEMLWFMKANRLDMAACGTDFFDWKSGEVVWSRVLPGNVVLGQPREWDVFFAAIHWNLRQVWGKLYTGKAASARFETETPDWFPKAYGGDTLNVFQCVRASKRIGVYGKKLHNYRSSPKSVSHQWIEGREDSDVILHEKAVEFLEEKCGVISENNWAFLYGVYWNAVKDTCRVLVTSSLPQNEKIRILEKILFHDITKQAFTADMTEYGTEEKEKEAFLGGILRWLTTNPKGKYSTKNVPTVEEICARMNPDFLQLVSSDRLSWYLRNIPSAVAALALCRYEAALEYLAKFLAGGRTKEVPVIYLAQTLSALLQKEDAYVAYEKMLVAALLRQGSLQEAEAELADWEQILQGDGELAGLREELNRRKAQKR